MGLSDLDLRDIALTDLSVAERNPRLHTRKQILQIAASIRQFGFTNPLLVDDSYQLIAGHGRLAAARELALATVPCIVLVGLTSEQRRQLLIADNQIADNATWDWEMLALELRDLDLQEYDLSVLGFEKKELDAMLGKSAKTDPTHNVENVTRYTLMVEYPDERQLQRAFEECSAKGLPCKIIE